MNETIKELETKLKMQKLYYDAIELVNIKSNEEALNFAKDCLVKIQPNINELFNIKEYNDLNILKLNEIKYTIITKLEIIDLLLVLKNKGLSDTNNYFKQRSIQENKYNELCKDIVSKYDIKGFKREFKVNVESDKITLSLFQVIKISITKDDINFKLDNDVELSIDDMSKISEIVSLVKNVVEV